jgi:hypothetical protein
MFKQYWILGIILVVLFAYYLGITIASVVDYRLKDAIINLPEPKVYINKENIEKFIDTDKNNSEKSKSKSKSKTKSKKFKNFEPTVKQSSNDTIIDQNQKAYAMSYKLAKTLMDNPLPFQASNSYDLDQNFMSFNK